MQLSKLKIFLVLALALFLTQNITADSYPKREMRAGWIATVWNLDWPKGTDGKAYYDTSSSRSTNQKTYLRNMIQNLKATGFNAVNFQVRGMCDAMYKSSYEPWSSALTNTRGKAPSNDWDPLAYCIEVCHELGMECHAWVNPFRFSTSATLPSTTNDMTLRNNGWIITHGTTSVLNPALEDARNYIVESVCKEIVQKYDIDGMVWDDYFYPNGIPSTSEAQDYSNYQSYKNAGGTLSIGDWRRNNVNTTVKMAFDMIQREKPYVKFGIAPAGVANEGARAHGIEPAKIASNGYQYNGIFADPCAWIIDGYIDYISPQLYWPSYHESAPFNPLCEWWNNLGNDYGVQCYISIDIASSVEAWTNSASNYEERLNQIAQVRATSVDFNPGQVFYSAGYLNGPNTSGFGEYLKQNVYQYQAITPKIVRTNEQQLLVNPGKVSNLALNSSTLSWTAVNSSTKHKYAVYAIPLSVGVIDASSTIHTDDGGFKAEYLVDVTYNTSLSGVPTGSYWYAVTAIDRYGNEWEAATLNAPKLGNVSVSLNAPTTGATLPFGDNTFSWTSDGASFLFQISTSEDFNRPLIEKELTTKNHTLNITPEEFEDGGTYYWRVVASKENYNSAWSEVRSFTIEPRPFIPLTLLSPENNSTIESDKINFEWEGVEGATYTFEIAEFPSFNTIIRTATLTNTNYSLDKSSFSGGKTYFWRIKAVKDGYQPSVSEQASFNTPKVEGETVDGLIIDELWIKSINTNNFPTQLSSCISARTMAAYNGKLYILERASDTECYLLEFDGKTCEFLKQIPLTGDIYSYSGGAISSWDHKAGQCIFSDGNGNLYISCLAIASEVRPLTVCSVNISTGATTKIFEANKTAVRHRIDYVNATGNLNAAGGQIWAATTDNLIYRWTRNSNGTWTEETTTIDDYYPNIVTALGTAPYIQPISSTQFIVDGASTHPTLYTFNSGSTATLNSSFADNAAIQPMNALPNGTCSITIGNTPLFVYVDDNHNGSGHSFSIVANKHNFDFSQFQFMKSIPEGKLGKVQHDYALDQPVAIKNDDGSATIFLYAPKNGLAAYRISLPEIEISLNSPADGETFEADFDFSWNGVDGASYTLEISKTSTFEDIAFTATTTSTSYNSSNFNLASETQYYWRVKASHPNYTSATSEVRQFTSPVKQSAIDNLTITELWNKSVNKGNFPDELGGDQRSMTAYNGNVYVINRTSDNKCNLLEFDGQTGSYLKSIPLTGDIYSYSGGTISAWNHKPGNGIFVDGGGNLCISCLAVSSNQKPLTVCTVDISTGVTTKVFEAQISTANYRIDYANAFGDITKDGGQIWAATSNNGTDNQNYIYRWTRNSNNTWATDYTIATDFQPSTGTNIGVGGTPWVMPISSDQFIVDGSFNYPTLYTFKSGGNATYIDGLKSNSPTDLKPKTIGAVGLNQLKLGKYPLFVYCNETHGGGGYDFNIVHNPSSFDFSNMEYCWTIPENRLGDVSHSYGLSSIAIIKNSDNSATLFVYAPNNGLAAYRISLPNVPIKLNSPINNVVPEKGFDFSWDGVSGSEYTIEISKSASFSDIAFSATTTNNSYSSTNFALDGETKYYWRVTAKNENYTTTTSSVGEFATSELPTIKVNLLLPYQTEQTISEFNFTWEALDGETPIESATYKIEISEAESFDKIFYSATTNNKIYSSKNIPLELNSKVYYWRVTASCNGYLTSTSEVRSFKSPTILNPTLYYPYNNLTFDKDFLFIALKSYIKINGQKEYADNSILEISKTEDFSEIYFQLSDQDKWIEMEGNNGNICLQYTMPISYLFNGTYYWRVRANKAGYDEQISAVRKFIVEGQSNSFGSEEESYQVLRENNSDYAPYLYNSSEKLYYTLTNIWIRNSERSPIDRWGSATSTDYRGFCTRHDRNGDQDGKDFIWIARHNGSIGYLEKYDANSGEYLGTVEITGTYEKSTYPCNDVFVDDGGNLCIMNLKGDSNDLEIVIVDTKTGQVQASPRFRVSLAGVRIDHANIVGDITSGKAYIFGATSNESANIYRWELQDGVIVDNTPIINKIATFYPSKVESTTVKMLGTAARIYPIDKDYFYVDGAGTSFTLYKFNEEGTNATLTSSFSSYSSNKDINPSSNHGNGGTYFIHDGIPFIVYNNSSFTSNTPEASSINYKYNIAKVSSLTEWGAITKYWGIPNDNIGTVANGGKDFGMLADYLQYDAQTGKPKSNYTSKTSRAVSNNDRTNIYIYVPGNGMAAYSLTRYKHIVTGAEDIETQNINIKITQDEITFGCTVDGAQLYTLSGMLVNSIEDASAISKPFAQGVYVLRITLNGVTSTHKIVIK
ncbi:MAG: family 10 glycosylhydrolase [Muribaculaceae bacterium]|nr:family 10 glycosylhydrolase [Muribaculaceae bacterium]